jgi:hypothetical protein
MAQNAALAMIEKALAEKTDPAEVGKWLDVRREWLGQEQERKRAAFARWMPYVFFLVFVSAALAALWICNRCP